MAERKTLEKSEKKKKQSRAQSTRKQTNKHTEALASIWKKDKIEEKGSSVFLGQDSERWTDSKISHGSYSDYARAWEFWEGKIHDLIVWLKPMLTLAQAMKPHLPYFPQLCPHCENSEQRNGTKSPGLHFWHDLPTQVPAQGHGLWAHWGTVPAPAWHLITLGIRSIKPPFLSLSAWLLWPHSLRLVSPPRNNTH